MKKVRFSGFPPRLRDEASLRTIFGTFGRVASLHLSSNRVDQVSGTCRFTDPEEAALTCSALKGLKIGSFTIQVEREEAEVEDPKKREEKKRKKEEEKRKKEELEKGKTSSLTLSSSGPQSTALAVKPKPTTTTTTSSSSSTTTEATKKGVVLASSASKSDQEVKRKREDGRPLGVDDQKKKPKLVEAGSKPSKSLESELKRQTSNQSSSSTSELKRQTSESSEGKTLKKKKEEELKRSSTTTIEKKSTASSTKIDVETAKEIARKEIKDLLKEKISSLGSDQMEKKKPSSTTNKIGLKKPEEKTVVGGKDEQLKKNLQKEDSLKRKELLGEKQKIELKRILSTEESVPVIKKEDVKLKNPISDEVKKMNADLMTKEESKAIPVVQNNKAAAVKEEPVKKTDLSLSRQSSASSATTQVATTSSVDVGQPIAEKKPDSSSAIVQSSSIQADTWEEYIDDRYNVPYYFNPETNETTWTLPPPGSKILKAGTGEVPGANISAQSSSEPIGLELEPGVNMKEATQIAAVATSDLDRPSSLEARESISLNGSSQPPLTNETITNLRKPATLERSQSSNSSVVAPSVINAAAAGGGLSMEERKGQTVKGTVTHLKTQFGFLRCSNTPDFISKDDMFFHFDELTPGYVPKVGDEVEFEIGFNVRRKQAMATAVRRYFKNRAQLPSSAPTFQPISVVKRDNSVGPPQPQVSTMSAAAPSARRTRSHDRQVSTTRPHSNRGRSRSPPPSQALRRQHSSPGAIPTAPPRWQSGTMGTSQRGRKELEWLCYVDRVSNQLYWYCPTTKETTWDNPHQ